MYVQIMIKIDLQKHNQTSFKARKIAVAKPVIDGIAKEIEVFTLSKNDKDTFCKVAKKVNLNELMPSKVTATNFPIWQKLIEITGDCIGNFKHQKIFLAIQDRKPCGVLLATANKKQAEVISFVTWPVDVDQRVKKAGSTLFTAFLDFAKRKNIEKIKLEPIIKGPTDAVGFYKAHGMNFPDPKSSVMTSNKSKIETTLFEKAEELNYSCIKKPLSPFKLSSKIDLEDA